MLVSQKKLRTLIIFTLLLLGGCIDEGYITAFNALCMPINRITSNSVGTIAADMQFPHQGYPHGVPESYDWSRSPRMGWGTDASNFTAFIAWGQVYEDAMGSPTTNTRVQIRNIRAYFLSRKDGRWHLLQSSATVAGGAYREDFVENISIEADTREEPEGGISVQLTEGYNFHFWSPEGRVLIDPDSIGGIFTTVEARLIVADEALPDDRAEARYLMSMGGDYWRDLSAEWQSDWSTVGDVAIGRFRYITSEWQSFNMTTLSPGELCQNHPPFE